MDADDGPAHAEMDPEDVLAHFGRELRIAREARGLTREGLAKRCGLSKATIKKLESGNAFQPRLETLVRLADGLGLTLLELVRCVDPRLSDAERIGGSANVWLAQLDEPSRELVLALVRVLARPQREQSPQLQEA
ncbi:MAG: helix-turn-helix domain-containing protein [Myxococcota bacterium]